MDVFVLHHIHVFDEDDEDSKLIGVYSTREQAEQAIERLRQQPGFCDTIEGFCINRHRLDKDNWSEGYISLPDENEE